MENEEKENPKEDLKDLVERLEKANAEAKQIQSRNEELIARNLIGGKTGFQEEKKQVEETDKEYAQRLISKPFGEVKIEVPY